MMNALTSPLLWRLAIRNIFRNKKRSLLTLVVVVAGVGSSIVLSALARGISEQMIKDAIFNLTGHIKIFAPEYREDPVIDNSFTEPSGELLTVLEGAGVARWVKRVRVPGVVASEQHLPLPAQSTTRRAVP